MEIRDESIGGFSAVRVRVALRAFLSLRIPISFENGDFKSERKTLQADFLAKELGLSDAEGVALFAALINVGMSIKTS